MTTTRPRMLSPTTVALTSLALLAGSACCKRAPPGSPDGGTECTGTLCNVVGEGQPAPSPVDFGEVLVGQSKSAKLTLKNVGGDTLNIGGEVLDGGNASDFKIIQKFAASEQIGQTLTATLQFTPSQGGTRSGVLIIHTDGDPVDVQVPLTGNGLDIELCAHPTTIDFGNVQVLGKPSTQALQLQNCGQSPVTISFSAITGPNATDFGETGESTQTLQPGQSVNVNVSYQPAAMGPSTANLPYDVCGGSCPQTINLTGVGVDGQLVCTPNPINFGTVPSGTAAPTMQVTCTNTGTEPLMVNSMGTYSGTNVFALSGLPAFPDTLNPLASFTFTVTYNTTGSTNGDSDELIANWTVADNTVPSRQYQDKLSGNQQLNPCSLVISPTAVSFGNVAPGTSASQSITLSNLGSTVCHISNLALGAGTDPYFALAAGQATSFTVQTNASAQVGVTFAPTSGNAPLLRKGSVTFNSDDPNNGSPVVPLSANISTQTQYAGGWPKWHIDNFNTGYSTADTSGMQGTIMWKYSIGTPSGGILSGPTTYINSPVIDGSGNVYQMNIKGKLYALSDTGTPIWTQQLSSPAGDTHPSTPAILADGSMFVASGSDGNPPNLYYLSSVGAVVFSEPYGEDGFDSCPALAPDDTLFLADDDGSGGGDPYSAIAFQASGNSVTQLAGVNFPLTAEAERFGSVVNSDGSTYWGNNGQFFGVTAPSAGFSIMPGWPNGGVTLFTDNNASGVTNTTIAVVSDLALDTVTNNNLYAYSASEDMNNAGNFTVGGNLVALDPTTGATKWTFTLPRTALPSGWQGLASDCGNAAPAIAPDGTVYVGNANGLYAIDGATGAEKWLFSSANVSSSPAIGGDGTIFFGVDDGSFYAVTSTGTLRFKVTSGGTISSSPAIVQVNGGPTFVAFTSDDGNVYAIQ
ncbi:MAG TPA: choice-of-anchor D domain-containing protein [Myxococcales bacterium]|nr:choice-of-anchor D domain-containing protein [Myxococcales bacterium]